MSAARSNFGQGPPALVSAGRRPQSEGMATHGQHLAIDRGSGAAALRRTEVLPELGYDEGRVPDDLPGDELMRQPVSQTTEAVWIERSAGGGVAMAGRKWARIAAVCTATSSWRSCSDRAPQCRSDPSGVAAARPGGRGPAGPNRMARTAPRHHAVRCGSHRRTGHRASGGTTRPAVGGRVVVSLASPLEGAQPAPCPHQGGAAPSRGGAGGRTGLPRY